MMNVMRCWVMLMLAGGMCVSVLAQDGGGDLYDLANEAADEEVEVADEVLAEDDRVHGEQWLTRDRLVMIAGVWVLLQVFIQVLVIRDLRRNGRGWLVVFGWVMVILMTSFLAGVVYWMRRKPVTKNE